MPQPPDWKRVLETGMHFTELRRSQAYRLASDLVAQGQLARDQIGAAVDELVEISRRRSEELRAVVSSEVQRQLSALGLATKRDLEALERRLRAKTPAPAAKKTATKRPPAKKRPATKAPAKSAGGKSAVKKSAAKKVARKTVNRKTAAKRTGARNAVRKPAAKRAR